MKEKNGFLLSLLDDNADLLEIRNRRFFESFLKDLKDYTPYSSIFLCRVSKKEAPTYYDVIKSPMDLGTMTRKLSLYDTRSFYEDLDLIWNNCFFFNKQSPFFINYAEKMKTKTESLKEFYFGEEELRWTQFEDLGGPPEIMYSTKGNKISRGIKTVTKMDKHQRPRHSKDIRNTLFVKKMVKLLVAQVLQSAGFACCSQEALEVLGDIFIFHTVGRASKLVE